MARPSDREYTLKRKIKELEEQLHKKDLEITRLQKQLEKSKEPVVQTRKTKKQLEQGCPNCGAKVSSNTLPFGRLDLCSSGCGWRSMVKYEK